jgi:hypothetical protein
MQGPERVSLGNICGGAAAEVFECELAKVLENIADPNTDPETARGLTLEFKFAPNVKRNKVAIAYVVKTKLATIKTEASNAFIAIDQGELGLYSVDQNQPSLPGMEPPRIPVVEEIRPLSAPPDKTATMRTSPPTAN